MTLADHVRKVWEDGRQVHVAGCECHQYEVSGGLPGVEALKKNPQRYYDSRCLALRSRLRAALVEMIEAWPDYNCPQNTVTDEERADALKVVET